MYLLIALLATTLSNAFATEVVFDKLGSAVGLLRCQPYPQTGVRVNDLEIYSDKFEAFSVAPDTPTHQEWLRSGQVPGEPAAKGEMFFFEFGPKNRGVRKTSGAVVKAAMSKSPYLDDTKSGRIYTVWNDRGFEVIKQAIVVWKRKGDLLTLESVLNRALLAGIGKAYVERVSDLDKGRHLLIGRTSGGDGGDTWGSIWVGLWTEPRDFKVIYSTDYHGDVTVDRRLDYELADGATKMRITRLARKNEQPDGTGQFADWTAEESWTIDLESKSQ